MRQHSPHHPINAAISPNPASPVILSPVKHPVGDWQALLAGSLTTGDQLARHLPSADRDTINRVAAQYPMRINPYYLALVLRHGEPLLRQATPSGEELDDRGEGEDPLQEESHGGGKLPRGTLHLPPRLKTAGPPHPSSDGEAGRLGSWGVCRPIVIHCAGQKSP